MEICHRHEIQGMREHNQQLSAEIVSMQNYVVELEVERTITKATGNAVMHSMDEAKLALQTSVQSLMHELDVARHAQVTATLDLDKLRCQKWDTTCILVPETLPADVQTHSTQSHTACRKEHQHEITEWKRRLESLESSHAESVVAQRQHLEAQMQRSLGLLEEQAANHVKSIQQKYTVAQSNASAMDEECAALKKRCGCTCTWREKLEGFWNLHVRRVLAFGSTLAELGAQVCQ